MIWNLLKPSVPNWMVWIPPVVICFGLNDIRRLENTIFYVKNQQLYEEFSQYLKILVIIFTSR